MAIVSGTERRELPVRVTDAHVAALPAWPVYVLLGPFMLWWAVGLADLVWVAMAIVMVAYLALVDHLEVPRGFGVWMLFLLWMLASGVMLDARNDAIEFVYRAAEYAAATVIFLYVYNARVLTDRRVCGALTAYWIWTLVGGVLGLLLPTGRLKTPLFYLLQLMPGNIVGIDFINQMVVRRFAQYNPDSYLGIAARPSAPFLYANNWGSVYSLLLPFVVAYLLQVRGTLRFWALAVLLPASAVVAFLTLNRGMLLGLSIAGVYVALRLAWRGRLAALVVLVLCAVAAAVVFNAVAAARLEHRVAGDDNSTSTRAYLYHQSLSLVSDSPVFGYGVPVQTENPDQPPVGTQGQFWMLLVSNGPVATAAFIGWFLIAFWQARKRSDVVSVAAATVLLVSVVELAYYGVVPYGLPIMMVAAALGTRPRAAN
ncbi:O-antigen ligase family protein [Nocardioides mangrovi]|uniref:O-antigen ligase family protein n=1 Tax=Nocardioides mangrovi TaxID=2874580 RepID=A0ABS7U7F4_9ACTN|nr:O-antigen ligase family protein [Nocardioides mangrovi]MBZ5736898.1 O-antigen ligase family protein [Nocardioides mangrovi]